jgi:hypothetical protein
MQRRKRIASSLLFASLLGPLAVGSRHHANASAAVEYPIMGKSSDHYETRQVEGWEVLINKGFLKDEPDLADRTLKVLGVQLYQITRVVPPEALSQLKTIRIWVEEHEAEPLCMTYHPDPGWLRKHDKDPAKARCVELANARTFLKWTLEQPWMLLHELSHGYHHQFLEGGFKNAEIKAAYDHAIKTHLYDRVLRSSGPEEKAYAATNPMEYFAEASEAYFGTNDFFPFVRIELKRHDPNAFDLLEKLWRVKPATAGKPAARKTPARKTAARRGTSKPQGTTKVRR